MAAAVFLRGVRMGRERLVVCVGAQKAGTSSLYALMKYHPRVCVSERKETAFFYHEDAYSKGYDWFLKKHFPDADSCRILFEADPNNMYFPRAITRIHQCNPGARLIVMLRNPADRAFSHYMMKRRSLENLSFEEACAVETERLRESEVRKVDFSYVDRGRYSKQIAHILGMFPRKQVLFVLFEEFSKDQGAVYKRIQEWLELPVVKFSMVRENMAGKPRSRLLSRMMRQPGWRPVRTVVGKLLGGNKNLNFRIGNFIEKMNQIPYPPGKEPKMNPETREKLLAELADDMRRVEALTGLDILEVWLKQQGSASE